MYRASLKKSYLSLVTPSPSVQNPATPSHSSQLTLQNQTSPSPSPHPNAGAIAYPTTNSSPCLKHYHNHTSAQTPPTNPNYKTHRPQIPHALIQRRRKNTPDITKYTLMLLHTQLAAQEAHNRCEALVCREFEDALCEVRGGADGLEADGYYSQIIKLILNER
jgi:hypothetical protein